MKLIFVSLFLFPTVFSNLDKAWWKHTTVYEVYLPSFKDSNGDGIGDLKGLISKLDHFVDTGIESVHITSQDQSPMKNGRYDISDFTAINPLLGTMEDFDELISQANARCLKVVMEIVINHSSDKHPWFIRSVNKIIGPYADFYVWKDPAGFDSEGKPIPPNNWVSILEGSAWTWNERRKQFYFHQYSEHQPDLNLRNPFVKREIKKILKFWLDKGVSGFKIDATSVLIEDDQFRDETVINPNVQTPYKYNDLDHSYTSCLPESLKFLYELQEFCDTVMKKFTEHEGVNVPEAYGRGNQIYPYYKEHDQKTAVVPINVAFADINQLLNAADYHDIINNYLKNIPKGGTPTWNSENHDKLRKAMVFNSEYEYIFTTLVSTLPGIAFMYYGQEIGMMGSRIREDQQIDNRLDDNMKLSRDTARLAMQWDDSLNAGFSNSHNIRLPPSSEYWRINVKKQKIEKNSHYAMFKRMLELRKTNTMKHGTFESYVLSRWVFAYTRTLKGHPTYLVVINLGSESEEVNLHGSIFNLPEYMTVEVTSANSGYSPGDKIPTSFVPPKFFDLRPYAVLILSFKP